MHYKLNPNPIEINTDSQELNDLVTQLEYLGILIPTEPKGYLGEFGGIVIDESPLFSGRKKEEVPQCCDCGRKLDGKNCTAGGVHDTPQGNSGWEEEFDNEEELGKQFTALSDKLATVNLSSAKSVLDILKANIKIFIYAVEKEAVLAERKRTEDIIKIAQLDRVIDRIQAKVLLGRLESIINDTV